MPTDAADRARDAELVLAARSGDREAFAALFERWFDRVYDVARNVTRDPDSAADVAQDTFVQAWERLDGLVQVESFGGWLLRITRNRALDRLRRDARARPVDGDVVTTLRDGGARDPVGPDHVPGPDEVVLAADRDALVHAAAAVLGERDASLLDLHLRHGLSPAEIAEELGVTPNNAHQLLFRLRAKLGTAIGSLLLWQRGRPRCSVLADLVGPTTADPARGAGVFDATVAERVERHRRGCEECTSLRAAMLSPAQLFASIPVVAAPPTVQEQVRQGLAEAGVPVPDPARHPTSTGPDPDGDFAAGEPTGDRAADRGASAPPGSAWGSGDVVAGPEDGEDPEDDNAAAASRDRRRLAALAGAGLVLTLASSVVWLSARSGAQPADAVVALPTATAEPSPDTTVDDTGDDPPAPTPPTPTVPRSGGPTATPGGLAPATGEPAPEPATTAPPTGVTTPDAPATRPPTTRPTPSTTPPPGPTPTPTRTPTPSATRTAPPVTPPPSSAPPAPTPAVLELTIGSGPAGLLCRAPDATPRSFSWITRDGTAAVLGIASTSRRVAPIGRLDACAASGDPVVLTVTGPGGADTETRRAP